MTGIIEVDFAISYAGEDAKVAENIDFQLRELCFDVFFAKQDITALVGIRADYFFDDLFCKSQSSHSFHHKYHTIFIKKYLLVRF